MQNDGLSTTSTRRVRTCITIYVRNNRRHKLHFRQIWDENNDMDSLIHHLFSKTKDENEKTKNYRTLSTKWALFIWMVYYIVILVKGLLENNLHTTDNSSAIIFMVINVFCFEFLLQKSRIERSYKRK